MVSINRKLPVFLEMFAFSDTYKMSGFIYFVLRNFTWMWYCLMTVRKWKKPYLINSLPHKAVNNGVKTQMVVGRFIQLLFLLAFRLWVDGDVFIFFNIPLTMTACLLRPLFLFVVPVKWFDDPQKVLQKNFLINWFMLYLWSVPISDINRFTMTHEYFLN